MGVVESECKMVSETVELVRSVNGKAKAIGQNGADRVADEELNGRHRNLEVASVCSRSDGKVIFPIEGTSHIEYCLTF